MLKHFAALLTLAAGLLLPVSRGDAQLLQSRGLSLEGARRVLAAAVAEARARNAGGAIAVVDEGGHLLALERLDGTFPAASRVSIGKAETAAHFRRSTGFFEEIVNQGRTTMVALEDFTPLRGGVPVVVEDHVVGAVGVSGANSAAQDEEIATAAAAVFTASVEGAAEATASSSPGVSYFTDRTVNAAFAKGSPLLEVGDYKIHASRRTEPGMAEVHVYDTDILYVLEGTATLVTGGSVAGGHTVGPGEIRGASITGGASTRLSPGDVMVVPRSTPHWFSEVAGPFLYYVVKVTEGGSNHGS